MIFRVHPLRTERFSVTALNREMAMSEIRSRLWDDVSDIWQNADMLQVESEICVGIYFGVAIYSYVVRVTFDDNSFQYTNHFFISDIEE